jgi:hypothetical protein
MLGPLNEGKKNVVFPFIWNLLAEKFIYIDSENIYSIIRLLEKLRPKYYTHSSYPNIV